MSRDLFSSLVGLGLLMSDTGLITGGAEVWFCGGLASMGAVILVVCRTYRSLLALDVLYLMLAKEALKAVSSRAPISGRLVFASKVSSRIFMMHLARSRSWVGFWAGVANVLRRASMVWALQGRLLLWFARSDMMSGAGLVI